MWNTKDGFTMKELIESIKNTIDAKKKDSFYYAYEAEKKLIRKEYKNALLLINKAIKKAQKENVPHLDLYLSTRAEVLKNLEKYTEALEDISKAIEIQPKVYLYYFESAEIKEKLNDKIGAKNDLNTIFKILDENDSAQFFKIHLAKKEFEKGNYESANEILKGTDDIKFNSENVISLKIKVHSELNDYPNLINDLDKMMEIFPLRTCFSDTKSLILAEMGKIEDAFKEINKAISMEPNNGRLYFVKGQIAQKANLTDNAIENFERAISLGLVNEDNKECTELLNELKAS